MVTAFLTIGKNKQRYLCAKTDIAMHLVTMPWWKFNGLNFFLSIMILCYINQIPSNPFTSIFNVICFFYVTTLIYDIFVFTHLNSTVRKSSRKLSKQRLNQNPYYTNIHGCLFYCVCTGITIISGGAKLFYVLKPRPLVKWCGLPSVCFLHGSKMLTLA